MNIARSTLAVVVGYLIFAASAFAFFRISGQPPHQAAPLPIMLESIAFGMNFALLGGYVAGWLAQRRPVAHGAGVAALLAIGGAVSLLSALGTGAVWSQMVQIGRCVEAQSLPRSVIQVIGDAIALSLRDRTPAGALG